METTRKGLKHIGVGLLGLVALVAVAAAGEGTQPNFVQLLADDQGWGDLGSFGHPFMKTPHIDRLAEEGITFTQCYSADSVCSPSRAAILTGRTPFRTGVYRWIPAHHFCHLPREEVTLPQVLRNNGYQTAHFGKWHLSHYSEKRIPGGHEYEAFDFGGELVGQPSMNEYGYDYWFATGNVARPNHKDPQNFFLNGEPMGTMEGFSAQLVAAEFARWMKEHRTEDQPFFVTIWFHEPHGPVNSDPAFVQRYKKLKDPSLRQYLANVTQIDEAVGSIIAALKDAGVYEDTMIWYTSDNGPEGKHALGTFNTSDSPYDRSRYRGSTGGLRGRKRHTHEGGIRVPGILSWPNGLRHAGRMPGSISAEPIIGSDVFPTLLEAAGVPIPSDRVLDGTSILPIVQGRPFRRSRPLYWRNTYFEFRVAIRDRQWKLVSNSQRTEFELYNLDLDPRETTDLSKHDPEVFDRMHAQLIAYDQDVLREGPTWWQKERDMKRTIPLQP